MFFKNQKGFTLLEIMLSTIIFVGALIPVLNLYSTGFVSSDESEIMTKALNLTRKKMEDIRSFDYEQDLIIGSESIDIGRFTLNYVNCDIRLSDESFYDGLRTITQIMYVDKDNNISVMDTGLKKIIVTTFCLEKDKKITKKIEFVTLRAE